jgi:hypothetical protein
MSVTTGSQQFTGQTGPGKPGDAAVIVAQNQLGKPYVYGAAGPDSFDCSGLLQYCYLTGPQPGISIGRDTNSQFNNNTQMTTICDAFGGGAYGIPAMVTESDLELGDCLYYFAPGNNGQNAHCMMYVGGSQCIQAPSSGHNVDTTPLQFIQAASDEPFRGVKRATQEGGGSTSLSTSIGSGSGTGGGGGSNASNTGLTPGDMAKMAQSMGKLNDPSDNLPFSAAFLGQIHGGSSAASGSQTIPISGAVSQLTGQPSGLYLPNTQLVRGGMMELVEKRFKVYFMMNPQQISVEMSFNQSQLNPFQVKDYWQSGGSIVSNQTVSFTIYFNRMYEVWQGNMGGPNGSPGPSGEGCRWDTRAVERLIGVFDSVLAQGGVGEGNNGWGNYPATMLPVQVAFGGPNSMQFQGFISSLDYTFTVFNSQMIPVECYVDIGVMRVYNPTESGADLTSSLVTQTGQVGTQKLPSGEQFTRY